MSAPKNSLQIPSARIPLTSLDAEQSLLASEIISLLPRQYASIAKRADSIQAIFNLSKKLDKRKKKDRQILQKIEKLIAMCVSA